MRISLHSLFSRIILIGFLSVLAFISLSESVSAQHPESCSGIQFIDGGSVANQVDDCAPYNSMPSCPEPDAYGRCLEYIRYGYPNSNECQVWGRTCSTQSCGAGFTGTYPECQPIPQCSDFGQQGVYPNCYNPPTCADYGQLGTYPNCYTPPKPTCEDSGRIGSYPNCYYPPTPTCADYGQLGTYPNCYNAPPPPTCADYGQLGTYPNCYYPPPPPTCADYGQTGTYPNCKTPTCQDLGNCPLPPPTCADYGQTGTFPNCSNPPTCADYGQQGNYPYCYAYPTCADYGQQGTYPNCTNLPTCADYGQLGNYPYCYAYPTCADYGQSGTYPNCYNACVANVGQGCDSSANSCGETNNGSVNCDGSCSAGTPSESSCGPGASVSCYPSSNIVEPGETVTWNASYSGFSNTPNSSSWSAPYGSPSSAGSSGTVYTTFNTVYASAGQYAANVSIGSSGGNASASCSPVTVADASCPIAATLTLTGSPTRVRSGQASTITYSFTNVPKSSSCTLTENGAVIVSRTPTSCGLESASLSRTITTQTTYRLTCDSKSEEFIVNILPSYVEF